MLLSISWCAQKATFTGNQLHFSRMANKKSSHTPKPKTPRPLPTQPAIDHFDILLTESRKFCTALGLHQDLIMEIYRIDSDWALILKIDALLEMAAKEVIRHGLRFKLMNRVIQNEILGEFVDSLPMAGRTSLLKLLDAAGFLG
ncbi:MAG TPA: hypothetical protein VK638_21370 [Edaphobacter sp.]|nr:hypothetical protein [Edaphobacter sp.]